MTSREVELGVLISYNERRRRLRKYDIQFSLIIDEYLYINNIWGNKPRLTKIKGTTLPSTLIQTNLNYFYSKLN